MHLWERERERKGLWVSVPCHRCTKRLTRASIKSCAVSKLLCSSQLVSELPQTDPAIFFFQDDYLNCFNIGNNSTPALICCTPCFVVLHSNNELIKQTAFVVHLFNLPAKLGILMIMHLESATKNKNTNRGGLSVLLIRHNAHN